uniref:phospholipase A2 n=1 Tax=Zea mays TaxID=4577 RepID=A0A804M2M5_MAIZE
MERGSSWRLPAVVVGILVCAALFSPPAAALNIGIQSAGDGVSKQQACSRTCESDHCTTPPFLRYGKYCGILYSGCPGEPPCDALDACCMHHDNCVQAKSTLRRYLYTHKLSESSVRRHARMDVG